jgi:hypothetical protein
MRFKKPSKLGCRAGGSDRAGMVCRFSLGSSQQFAARAQRVHMRT